MDGTAGIPSCNVNAKLILELPGTDPPTEDPEDMMLGQTISLGSYVGNFGNFTIPHKVTPGNIFYT